MKKRYTLFVILVLFFVSSKAVQSSAEDIEIQKYDVYQEFFEVYVYFEGISLPIGFHVWFDDVEITTDCSIKDTSIFSDSKMLVINTPNEVGNHNITISFYDHTFTKSFTIFIDYYGTTFNLKDLFMLLAIFSGILTLNLILYLFALKRSSSFTSARNMLPITDEERRTKWLIMMIISLTLLLYYSFHPFFYYPQITNFSLFFFNYKKLPPKTFLE